MNIRNIIEDALEKYPPVIRPEPIFGIHDPVPFIRHPIDATQAANWASQEINYAIQLEMGQERILHAETKQKLDYIKQQLSVLTKDWDGGMFSVPQC